MSPLLRKLKELRLRLILIFSFSLGLGLASAVLAFSLPFGSHVYRYESVQGGQGYKLEYYTEFNKQQNLGGCAANQCYFGGKCYEPGQCLYTITNQTTDKNQYCLLGSWRSSCGNGLVQPACGEECEFTGGANFCNQKFGQRNWYGASSIKIQCGSSCTWQKICSGSTATATTNCTTNADCPSGQTCESAASVYTIKDCSGFCGDGTVQTQFGEQCDTGKGEANYLGGTIPSIYQSGPGGSNVDNQYACNNNCRVTGGFCGNGIVENGYQEGKRDANGNLIYNGAIDYGEKCDFLKYNPPSAANSSATNQYQCQPVNPTLQNTSYKICVKGSNLGSACSSDANCGGTVGSCSAAPPCWPTGGYCGDRTVNGNEECDPSSPDPTKCTNSCKKTYCGDGTVQKPNGWGQSEVCDSGLNNGQYGYCASGCSGVGIAGNCSTASCAQGLVCDATTNVCKGSISSKGCQTNSDCLSGLYCDTTDSTCKLVTSVFLNLHPTTLPTSLGKALGSTGCPALIQTNVIKGVSYDWLDQCTGLVWAQADSKTTDNPPQTVYSASGGGCSDPYVKPTVRQLWSLVSPWQTQSVTAGGKTYNLYTNEDNLKLINYPNYLYWASDKFDGSNSYAINFVTGGNEVYSNNQTLGVRCVRKPPYCGDNAVDGNEACDSSTPTAKYCGGVLSDKPCSTNADCAGNPNGNTCQVTYPGLDYKTCSSLGFAGDLPGSKGLQCTNSCTFDKANCQNYSTAIGVSGTTTCSKICGNAGRSCLSVGTNTQANDGTYWTYDFSGPNSTFECLTKSGANCTTAITSGGQYQCGGNTANWTYCNCGAWPTK